jgi:hypothetical protein
MKARQSSIGRRSTIQIRAVLLPLFSAQDPSERWLSLLFVQMIMRPLSDFLSFADFLTANRFVFGPRSIDGDVTLDARSQCACAPIWYSEATIGALVASFSECCPSWRQSRPFSWFPCRSWNAERPLFPWWPSCRTLKTNSESALAVVYRYHRSTEGLLHVRRCRKYQPSC